MEELKEFIKKVIIIFITIVMKIYTFIVIYDLLLQSRFNLPKIGYKDILSIVLVVAYWKNKIEEDNEKKDSEYYLKHFHYRLKVTIFALFFAYIISIL